MAQEIASKRTDLLLEWGESSIKRTDELESQKTNAKEKIDILKGEISIGERETKGISLFENNHVTIHDDESSTVLSESGKSEYLVNKRNGTCKCKDYKFTGKYGIVCKHRIADKLARTAQDEESHDEGIVTFASVED